MVANQVLLTLTKTLPMRFPRTLYLFPLTVFVLFLTTVAHAGFVDGMISYIREDYATALNEWLPLASPCVDDPRRAVDFRTTAQTIRPS